MHFEIQLNGPAVDTWAAIETRKTFDQNAKEVIFSALTFEKIIKDYISDYFVTDPTKLSLFHETIASSSDFTFSNAIRVFVRVLSVQQLATSSIITEAEQLL